jgi:hypothetical protein
MQLFDMSSLYEIAPTQQNRFQMQMQSRERKLEKSLSQVKTFEEFRSIISPVPGFPHFEMAFAIMLNVRFQIMGLQSLIKTSSFDHNEKIYSMYDGEHKMMTPLVFLCSQKDYHPILIQILLSLPNLDVNSQPSFLFNTTEACYDTPLVIRQI